MAANQDEGEEDISAGSITHEEKEQWTKKDIKALRKRASPPIGTRLLNVLRLASPRDWHTIATLRQAQHAWVSVAQSLADGTTSLQEVVTEVQQLSQFRFDAVPETWKHLGDAIEEGLAYRKRRYDVYLPFEENVHKDDDDSTAQMSAILLFPGAAVDQVAYADPALLFAQEYGYVVVTVSAEPWRLTTPNLGFDAKTINRIMKTVEKRHSSISEWFLLGHSMGSFATTHIVEELGISKVAMWAVAPFASLLLDLSRATGVEVCLIQGSVDTFIAQYADLDTTRDTLLKYLPKNTVDHVIVNGTHSGFASYMSDDRFIPHALDDWEQQEQATRLTHKFFSNEYSTVSTNELGLDMEKVTHQEDEQDSAEALPA